MTTSAKTSLLLIGIGALASNLCPKLLQDGRYRLTVFSNDAHRLARLRELGIATIEGGLQDLDRIRQAVRSHEIIINSASSDNIEAAKAMIGGLDAAGSETKKVFVQVSGAAVYGHSTNLHKTYDHVYDDIDYGDLNTLAPNSPHRQVDLLFWAANQAGIANIVIAIPSALYGGEESLFPNYATHIPARVEAAYRDGFAKFGTQSHLFGVVNVEDASDAILLVLQSLATGRLSVVNNPYINIVQREHYGWQLVADRISQQFVRHGVWNNPSTRSGAEWDLRGDTRSRSSRLYHLGWQERFSTQLDFEKGIDFHVEAFLKKEGVHCG